MFDCDVNLGQCTEIRFIEHKAYSCSKNGSSCKDLKRQPWDAGAQVMAYVLGRGLTHVKGCLRRENSKHEKEVGFSVGESLRDLYDALAEGGVSGTHKNPKRADVVLRGALLQYGHGELETARELIGLLASEDVLKAALERVVCEYLEMPTYSIMM